MTDLRNKVALVTGASRGIGAAIAIDLAKAGADVVLNYNSSREKAEKVQKAVNDFGVKSLLIQANVAKIDEIEKMFTEVKNKWGKVDILVNNAGVETRQTPESFDENTFDWIMNTNLKGAFFCSQLAIPGMKEKKWGRIINISSVHEIKPTGFCAVYGMTKGGIGMMMRELAYDFSQFGITVNNIAPGAIRTDINREVLLDPAYEAKVVAKIPARFIGESTDVSQAVVFLASNAARYITGTTLFIDGGLSM